MESVISGRPDPLATSLIGTSHCPPAGSESTGWDSGAPGPATAVVRTRDRRLDGLNDAIVACGVARVVQDLPGLGVTPRTCPSRLPTSRTKNVDRRCEIGGCR